MCSLVIQSSLRFFCLFLVDILWINVIKDSGGSYVIAAYVGPGFRADLLLMLHTYLCVMFALLIQELRPRLSPSSRSSSLTAPSHPRPPAPPEALRLGPPPRLRLSAPSALVLQGRLGAHVCKGTGIAGALQKAAAAAAAAGACLGACVRRERA